MQSSSAQELRREVRGIRREIIFTNLAVIVLGLLMVLFPDSSTDLICRATGAILCIWGIIRIVSYFAQKSTEAFASFALVQGAAMLGFGIYFLVRPEFLASFLSVVLGIILIVGGVMKLQYAIDFLRLKATGWWIQIAGALVMAVLGVVALVNPFAAANTLTIFLGAAFLLDGVWDLVAVSFLSHFVKKVRQAVSEANAVETDFTVEDK